MLVRTNKHNTKNNPHIPKTSKDEQKPQSQNMVRCDWCQVYTPEIQAIRLEQHHFCCEDHRQHWLEKHHD